MTETESTIDKLSRLFEPVAADLGLEIVQVQCQREAIGWIVRVLIDRPEGVGVNDCEGLSRELSALLDVHDPIPHRFALEVSSPGLDRPLTKPVHFERFAGEEIELRTRQPIEGRRVFRGRLQGLAGLALRLDVDQKTWEIPLAAVEKAHLIPDWDESPRGKGKSQRKE